MPKTKEELAHAQHIRWRRWYDSEKGKAWREKQKLKPEPQAPQQEQKEPQPQ